VVVDRRVLPRQPDAGPHLLGMMADVDPGHAHPAPVGLQQSRQHPDEGGLAGPVRAEQPVDAAALHGQVEAIQRTDRDLAAEHLDQVLDLDDRVIHRCSSVCVLQVVYFRVNHRCCTLPCQQDEQRDGDMPTKRERIDQPAATATAPPPVRRLRRAERREQLLAAATQAFARTGFAATSLDDIAEQAGISRVLLYRHFESKTDLYHAVLDRAVARLTAAVGVRDYTYASIDALLRAAAEDPDGFRLLFHHAAREPEFRQQMDRFQRGMVATARRELVKLIPDRVWTQWAARLAPVVAIEAVMAWLDAGQPDPDQAADRIRQALAGVISAAQ